MPYKDVIKRRAAHKRYYDRHPDIYKEKNTKRKRMLLAYINDLKQISCIDCGNSYPPYVMDFDHRNKDEKIGSVARLIHNGWSKTRLLTEIKKCDLVCANCHRIRTYKRLIAE